jgi:C-terminal processing protease CtpA/Prc
MKQLLILILVIICFSTLKTFPQNFLPHPYNLDFEIGEVGLLPKGWIVPSYAEKLGYKAYTTNIEPKTGKQCLELFREGEYIEDIYGSVMQSIDASAFRGKKIRIRAAIKAEIHSPKGSAHLWVRERFKDDDQVGLFEFMAQNPIVLREWKYYEIEGWISNEALYLNYGLLLFGNGKAWLDDVSIEILDSSEVHIDKPAPLSTQQTMALIDFAKVYGVIRYFYPSDQAKKTNWDNFAFYGVKSILNSNKEIPSHQLIEQLFKPVAPLLKIAPKNEEKINFHRPKNALNNVLISQVHYGLPFYSNNPLIRSEVINHYIPTRKYQGIVEQIINVSEICNKTIDFSIHARGKLIGLPSKVLLVLRFDNIENKIIDSKIKEIDTLDFSKWQNFKISSQIPSNTVFLRIALILVGEGDIYFDDAKLSIEGDKENLLKNPSFESEKDTRLVFGWKLIEQSEQNGYLAKIVKTSPLDGEKSLLLKSDTETMITLPEENSTYTVELNDGYSAIVPLTLFVDSLGTLPHSNIDTLIKEIGHPTFAVKDRISRIATAIILWNLIQHFSIFLHNDWKAEAILEQVLQKTATDSSLIDFSATLETMLHFVADNQVRIWHKDLEKYTYTVLPFQWTEHNGKIIITDIGKDISNIERGDEVIEVNGRSIQNVIDSVSLFLSYSNPEWKYLKSLAYIRYNFSPKIILTIKKVSGKLLKVELESTATPTNFIETRPEAITRLTDNILYFDLTRIQDKELKEKLDSLKPTDYYIFDLRGFVIASEHFLTYFMDSKAHSPQWLLPVFTFPNRAKISWNKVISEIYGKALIQPKGIYFLIDERTVGVGEIIASIVREFKIGKLVGRSTGGSPSEIATFSIPCGFNLAWSFLKVIDYNGKEIYKNGLLPHIPVKKALNKDNIDVSQDLILLKAIELTKK